MIFLKIFLAWVLFCWGVMIFVSEAHEYITAAYEYILQQGRIHQKTEIMA